MAHIVVVLCIFLPMGALTYFCSFNLSTLNIWKSPFPALGVSAECFQFTVFAYQYSRCEGVKRIISHISPTKHIL